MIIFITSKEKIIILLTKKKMIRSSICQVFLVIERTRLNARYVGGNFSII